MDSKLQFALKDDKLMHINAVESGLDCGCFCPSCGSKLVAKKGKIKIHHFAHYNSEECKACVETAIHLLAKEIFSEESQIKLPQIFLDFGSDTYKERELICDEKIVGIDKVYLEHKIEDIIPDIIIESNGAKLLVEIFVTHDIDEMKLIKIKKLGISALLINLSKMDCLVTKEELKDILINRVIFKEWIFNKKERAIYKRFKENARTFETAEKGNGVFCPQYLYGWKGVSSARTIDCLYCEYCFSLRGKANCLGYSGISKVKDLGNPKLAEIAVKLRMENKIKPEWLPGTQCTKCRQGYMKLVESKNGSFLGCSKYPNCEHRIKI